MSGPIPPELLAAAFGPDEKENEVFPKPLTLRDVPRAGHLAARNRNPGNLRDPKTGEFRNFATVQEGFTALVEDVIAKQTGNTRTGLNGQSSILDFFSVYAPPHENNTVQYAQTVATNLGVTLDTPIGELDPHALADAIALFEDREYWTAVRGSTTPVPTEPPPVQGIPDSLLKAAFPKDKTGPLLQSLNITAPVDVTGMGLPPLDEDEALSGIRKRRGYSIRETADEDSPIRRVPGETRVDYLERTKEARESAAFFSAQSTIEAAPTGLARVRQMLGNMRFFTGEGFKGIISFEQTHSGLDVGLPARLGAQLFTPTVGELLEGNFTRAIDNTFQISGSFVTALADPFISYPIKLAYDEFSGNEYLLPEEREAYIRSAAANYAGLIAGGLTRSVLSSGETALLTAGRKTLGAASIPELRAIAARPGLTGFRARLTAGAAEGVVGGATAGVIEGKTPEERRDLAAGYALIALPLGFAFEALHSAIKPSGSPVFRSNKIAQAAADLYALKQLRLGEATTMDEITSSVYRLATEKDLIDAVIRSGFDGDEPILFSGIELTSELEVELRSPRYVSREVNFISGDDALGSKLLDDVYDPAMLDPETGNSALVARAGAVVTPDIIKQIGELGLESVRTTRGVVAIEFNRLTGTPLFAFAEPEKVTLPGDIEGITQGGDTPGKPARQVFRRGSKQDLQLYSSKNKVGERGTLRVPAGEFITHKRPDGLHDVLWLPERDPANAAGDDIGSGVTFLKHEKVELNSLLDDLESDPLGAPEAEQAHGFLYEIDGQRVNVDVDIVREGKKIIANVAWFGPAEELYAAAGAGAFEATGTGRIFDIGVEATNAIRRDVEARLPFVDEIVAEKMPTKMARRPEFKPRGLELPGASGVTKEAKTIDTFIKYGFFRGQAVSFLGQDYTYMNPIVFQGKLQSHAIRDASGRIFKVAPEMLQRNPELLVSSANSVAPGRLRKSLYNDFLAALDAHYQLEGKNLADAVPDAKFDDLVNAYMIQKEIPLNERPAVKEFLEQSLHRELMEAELSPVERSMYEKLLREVETQKIRDAENIASVAAAAGTYLDYAPGGSILLREADTGASLGVFETTQEARKFLVDSGRSPGPSLEGSNGGAVPPTGVRGVMTPPPAGSPHTAPYSAAGDGWLRRLSHLFNTSGIGQKLTGMRQVMIALDSQLGTRFTAEIWDKNHEAFIAKFAAMHDDMQDVADMAKIVRSFTPEERAHLTNLLETISAEDMIRPRSEGGLLNRPFNDRELAGAQWFIGNRIDIPKAFEYIHALRELEFKMRNAPEHQIRLATRKLQAAMNIDEIHVEAARIIGALKQRDPAELSLLGIIRLARAQMEGHLSPKDYIKKHGLSPKVVKVYELMKAKYDELAPTFDIPEESILGGYMPHYRVLKDDVMIANHDNIPIFVNELIRSGELIDYERDAINNLVHYINLGYGNKYTKQVWDASVEYLKQATKKLDDGPHIRKIIQDNYLNELRGIPHDSASFFQRMMDGFLERLGVKTSIDVRKDLVNTFLSLTSSATIGFRPMQGIRDFQNFVSIFYSRFGAARTTKMLTGIARYSPDDLVELGLLPEAWKGKQSGTARAMHEAGLTPTISPVNVQTAEEALQAQLRGQTTDYRSIIQSLGNAGIKWGGQHTVYQFAHAAAYLESYTTALEVLNDLAHQRFGRGADAKAKAYRKLKINTYDEVVGEEFDKLVTAGKFEDAAKFLGRASSFETVSVFGLANHPVGWGTNSGRLIGQFGTWPVWARSQLMRMASRGTYGDRAAAMTRFAMTQGATAAASWALGLNLSSWYVATGAFGFRGGPIANSVLDEISYIGGDDRRQALTRDAVELLSGDFDEANAAHIARMMMLGVPASFLLRDIYEATTMAANGGNPISALARALGVRSTENPSLLNPSGVRP